MNKLIRITTVPQSLDILLRGQLAFLSTYYDVIGVSSGSDTLDKVALREGVRTIVVDMERQISIHKDIVSLWRLYRLFKKEKPLIVHSITPKAGLLSMMASRLARVPIRMHTFTGLIFPTRTGIMQNILILMDRLLCRCATNVYPEGQGVKADLIRHKITRKPLKILANGNVNGIDLPHFAPDAVTDEQRIALKNELGIKPGDFTFIFIGRQVGDKGINELIEAFNAISTRRVGVKLLLVGAPEPELDPLSDRTTRVMRENKAIIPTGYQFDVRPYLAVSDALAFPSYREGFPNVVMQAGAMGLPSIVTDINGCNEIISGGDNGLIIPPRDSHSLQVAMERIMDDEALRTKLHKNARIAVASRYDRQSVWDALLEEYRSLHKS
jgi:glycosyltransferase involved in cell wall biosynthesis